MPSSDSFDALGFLAEVAEEAQANLSTPVEIAPARKVPDIDSLPLGKTQDGKFKWRKIEDASVVATDLKSSTAVSYSKQEKVGARLYEASSGGCARILQSFYPDYVDIQGDGLFAVFSGDLHAERAMAAAISLNSFGLKLAVMLAKEFGEDVPEMKTSGLKIGADRGTLLVKKIGVRGPHNEPVWAGKPVNYATKCAQEAGAGEAIVTSRFFRDFKDNEYIRFSCGCVGGDPDKEVSPLWEKVTLDVLGDDGDCRKLATAWCSLHGTKFCEALLDGEKERPGLNTGPIKKWREPPVEADAEAA